LAGCCECSDEPSGSATMELVIFTPVGKQILNCKQVVRNTVFITQEVTVFIYK
jgi:hypothetical protein